MSEKENEVQETESTQNEAQNSGTDLGANNKADKEQGGGDLQEGEGNDKGEEVEQGNAAKPELSESELLEKLEKALTDNTAWLEQVKLTLLSVYSLFKTHEGLKKGYEFVLKEANRLLEENRKVYNDTLALKESTAELNAEVKEAIAAHLELIKLKTAKMQEVLDSARDILNHITIIRDEIITAQNEIEHDKEAVRHFLERVEALRLELDGIDARLERANTLINKFETLYGEKKAEFTHELNEAIAQLEGFKSFVNLSKTQLNAQKEEILNELESTKESAKEELKEAVRNNMGALWKHIFNIESVLLEKGVVSLEDSAQGEDLQEGESEVV